MEGQDRAPSFDEMILERFVRKQPIAAGLRFVLERLFDAGELNDLFERHRVRQYSGKILFAAVVQVMLAVYIAWLSGPELDAAWRFLMSKPMPPEQRPRPLLATEPPRLRTTLPTAGGSR